MLWKKGRRSDNVVDARSDEAAGGGGGLRIGRGGLSLGAVALVIGFALLTGQDPLRLLGELTGTGGGATTAPAPTQSTAPAGQDEHAEFVRAILGDTEDTWRQVFADHGRQYQDPKLVLFNGRVNSACGTASSAVGPFYCPADRQVYLDMSFFRELRERFHAAGDFAEAYVIAHEVGHHVQTLLGLAQKVDAARQQGRSIEGANGLLVRQELQADCLAGVWAWHAQQRLNWLEPGDVEEALNAANAIGDDRLQQQSQGQVVPDAFTHGTSAQRVHWFKAGFDTGKLERCDTFAAGAL